MWLTDSYSSKIFLHGIIYLHRISDVRLQGSARKNIIMFRKLCGSDALKKVILTTTMWDKIPGDEARQREKQLMETRDFWGWMMEHGSTVRRHDNTQQSAAAIIRELARDLQPVTLDLQDQMVNQKLDLSKTSAGQELESVLAREREKMAQELAEVQQQMKEAIRERDEEAQKLMKEMQDEYLEKTSGLEKQILELKTTSEQLHDERMQRLEEELRKQSEEHAAQLETISSRNVRLGAELKVASIKRDSEKEWDMELTNQYAEEFYVAFGPTCAFFAGPKASGELSSASVLSALFLPCGHNPLSHHFPCD